MWRNSHHCFRAMWRWCLLVCLFPASDVMAQAESDSILPMKTHELDDVTVISRRQGTRRVSGAVNGQLITRDELFKAACCNLGESFVTNPSVDVNYNDATTGAKQIKLLGLAGTYVQMLTENIPNFRGAAMPYALGYVPGPWMKSIQVSKGCSSVKNGYESITGQINIQYLQPEDEEGLTVNLYTNTQGRAEGNLDINRHLTQSLSTELLGHYENEWGHHDGNHDGFYDQPKVRQWHLQNRWAYLGERYIMHAGAGIMKEKRNGGQTKHHEERYQIGIETDRYEAYMKHAFVLDKEKGGNIALMGALSQHDLNASYGYKGYDVRQKNIYLSLMYEANITPRHNISSGVSLNYDHLSQHFRNRDAMVVGMALPKEIESTPGAYLQYTFNEGTRWTLMAGIRVDHSRLYGTFWTPRMHLKYSPTDLFSLRLSAGKGYRTVHALAENNFLLASGRTLIVEENLKQEEAWNYGLSTAWNIPLLGRTLRANAEYYYTHFMAQALTDYDIAPFELHIRNKDGKSYSHTLQIDASYELFKGMTLLAAYRRNFVKAVYGGQLREKPLNSRYKALVSASYKTPLGLWQVDATWQLNGGGRMPLPYTLDSGESSWDQSFGAYSVLNAQVTRWLRHFSIYVGGENLTNFKQKKPIIGASEPWSRTFEPTMIWGPVMGAMFYAGIRINFGRL